MRGKKKELGTISGINISVYNRIMRFNDYANGAEYFNSLACKKY
jgi:hypothetical protein